MKLSRLSRIAVGTAFALAVGAIVAFTATSVTPVANAAGENFGVTICHRTGADKNPYHSITPSNIGVYSAHV